MDNTPILNREPISALGLRAYWKRIDAGQEFNTLPSWQMPPWTEICEDLNWHLYPLGGGYFQKKHHGYQGVYRLFGLAEEGDATKPATLNRACGQDPTGTLYIGKSGTINVRLNQMRKSRHNAIDRLRCAHLLNFPIEKLAVGFLFTGRSIGLIESYLVQAYMNSFGDSPPLNVSY